MTASFIPSILEELDDVTILTPSSGQVLRHNGTEWVNQQLAHSDLSGLTADDHTQYALLAGRAGGQALIGGDGASENLTLKSTSHATKGKILFGTSAYNEVNNMLGIGTVYPSFPIDVVGSIRTTSEIYCYSLAPSRSGAVGNYQYPDIHGENSGNRLLLGGTAVGLGTVEINTLGVSGPTLHCGPSGNVGINTASPTISGAGKLHMAADTFRLDTARTPASAGAAGNQGEWCWDANYIYVCIATNTWRRVAHAAW